MALYKKSNLDSGPDFTADFEADMCDQTVSDALSAFSYQSESSGTTSVAPSGSPYVSEYAALSDRERASKNCELDESFVLFLVHHTTDAISAEIALELCLVNYIVRKQLLNGVSSRETQIIRNWKEIFTGIEALILGKISRDSNAKRHVFDTACMGSIDKCSLEREASLESILQASKSGELNEEEYKLKVGQVESRYDDQLKQLKQQLKSLVDLITKSETSVVRKVVRTLLYVSRKVCYMWAEFNGCLGLITEEQRQKYAKRCADHDTLQRSLAFAETNNLLLLRQGSQSSAVSSLDLNTSGMTSTSSSSDGVVENQSRVVKAGNNHVQDFAQVIRGIAVDKEQMKDLIEEVMWVKMPRNCTSFSQVLSSGKKAAKKEEQKECDGVIVQPPSKASVENMANFLKSGKAAPNTTPEAVKAADFCDIDSGSFGVIQSYDSVIRLLMLDLHAGADGLHIRLNYRYKAGRNEMLLRLRFLQFLVSHRTLPPGEVMELLAHSDMYNIFSFTMWMKAVRADAANICSDGYCFYRCLYQLYLREQSSFKRTVDEMVTDDKLCNATDAESGASSGSFVEFMTKLPSLIKPETPAIRKMFPVQYFKFVSDQDVLRKLLTKRAGRGVPKPLYGNQADVYFLKFNVAGWELVADANVHEDLDPSSQWMRYINCSLDKAFEPPTLTILDELCSVVPNFLCHEHQHFFVVENPSMQKFAESVAAVKDMLISRLMEGVQLLSDPDLFLEELCCVIQALEDSSARFEIGPFPISEFEAAYSAKFPASASKTPSVDLSALAASPDRTAEVCGLLESLRISEEKVHCIIPMAWNHLIIVLVNSGCNSKIPRESFGGVGG